MNRRRREFMVLTAAGMLAPVPVLGQGDRKLRIGILSSGTIERRGHLEEALLYSLREQGYVEGRNLSIERRYAGMQGRTGVAHFAQELSGLNLDMVVSTCSTSTDSAKKAMATTPIIMAAVSDPVGHGLIATLARPGGNITGLSSQGEELLPKMIDLFARVLPPSPTIAALANAANPVHVRMWQRLQRPETARARSIRFVRAEFSGRASLPGTFDAALQEGAGALIVLGDDPLTFNLQPLIVELAAKHRLPDFYWAREFVDAGGLMSYGENLRSDYRSAGIYVARVAKGAKPADLPVQQPTKFELILNKKRAKALGISIPQDLVLLADEVIE